MLRVIVSCTLNVHDPFSDKIYKKIVLGLFVETVERVSPLCAFWLSRLPDGVVGEESIGVFREGRKKVTPTLPGPSKHHIISF